MQDPSAPLSLSTRREQLSEAKRALLEKRLRGQTLGRPVEATPLGRRTLESPPLSFAQQRLWFLDQLAPGNPFYSESSGVRLAFCLDEAALQRALNEIVRRHEVRCTRFPSRNGEPVQVIDPVMVLTLTHVDLRGLRDDQREAEAVRLAAEDARRSFDLAQGPLIRGQLVHLDDEDFLLLLAMHHIVCDGWSMEVFFRELSVLYDACCDGRPSPLPELAIQYADFAVWQREWLQGDVLERQLKYWTKQLEGLSTLELPTLGARPVRPTYEGASELVQFSARQTDSLRRLSQREGVTLFMSMLAGFVALLHRYSGQDEIVVGCPIANRTREETEALIGLFVNTLVMRTDVSGDPTFRELLARVRETALGAFTHQDLPFEKLVEEIQPERDTARNPLFQVTFQLYSGSGAPGPAPQPGAPFAFDVKLGTAKFDLRFDLSDTPGGLAGQLEYSTELFDAGSIARMIGHLHRVYDAMGANPELRLSEVPLLTDEERHALLVRANDTAVLFRERSSVLEWFEEAAAAHGETLAIADGETSLSYGDLNARAGRVAARLTKCGVSRDVLVAVCLERSIELAIAELAVWKAGGAFVPIDPSYPAERIAFMVCDSRAPVLLTSRSLERSLEGFEQTVLCVDALGENTLEGQDGSIDADLSDNRPRQDDLAYVIYTSGSSGRPKGVAVPHRALLNLIGWHHQTYGVTRHDRASLMASPAFDASVWEIWPYLTAGASVHVVDDGTRDAATPLLDWFVDNGITLAFVPTPLAELLVDEPLPAGLRLRALLTGGDRLRRAPSRRLPFSFVNHYGPTEIGVVATFAEIAPGDGVPLIGRPIANTRVFVVDRQGMPVPRGVAGELWIGGAGVARGYWGQEELTAARFATSTWGERVYRSGDRVVWRDDGLEFLGRDDQQVQVRGHRVELAEVEAAIAAAPEVAACVVDVREAPGGRELVGYVVPRTQMSVSPADAGGPWQAVFDDVYKGRASADPRFEVVGWRGSDSDAALGEAEMREWRDETLTRLRAVGARRVLEIGCGTGLLLFPLAADADEFVGTDFSGEALEHVRAHAAGLPVRLEFRSAEDWTGLPAKYFDLVILNSVVQYFPDESYLRRVLTGAAQAVRPGGHVFVGDVRHVGLQDASAAWVEVRRAAPKEPAGAVAARVRERILGEEELLIAPDYFAKLGEAIPDLTGWEVQAKLGLTWNELTRFRYDVLLQVGGVRPAREALAWRAWAGESAAKVAATPGGWRGVHTARLSEPLQMAQTLRQAPAAMLAEALWAASVPVGPTLEPEAVRAAGAAVQVRYGEPADRFDLVVGSGDAGWRLEPVPTILADWAELVNAPRQGQWRRALVPRLRARAAARLPEWMVPAAWVLLEQLPLTTHGKIDRRALPAPDLARSGRVLVAPRTAVEAALAQIWRELLGQPRIGVTENFFQLGGHSLLATQLLSRARAAFQIPLPLRALFEAPTIAAQAQYLIDFARQQDPNNEARLHRTAELLLALSRLSDDEVRAQLAGRQRVSASEAQPWLP